MKFTLSSNVKTEKFMFINHFSAECDLFGLANQVIRGLERLES